MKKRLDLQCITSSAETGGFSGILADTWAAGVTLFFMAYGQCPFRGANFMETYSKIRNDPVRFYTKNDDFVLNMMI